MNAAVFLTRVLSTFVQLKNKCSEVQIDGPTDALNTIGSRAMLVSESASHSVSQ